MQGIHGRPFAFQVSFFLMNLLIIRSAGYSIVQIRLIVRPIGKSGTTWSWNNHCVTYVQYFNISNDCNPTTQRQRCSNGLHMGDITPVSTEGTPCPPLCGYLSHSIQ